jgi:hypothetical protein
MTLETGLWIVGSAAGLFVLDRLLLWVESRGWIYYRRNKPGRGASTYHLLEWNSAFDPTMRQVQEERIKEEKGEEEAGDPPVPEPVADLIDPGPSTGPRPSREGKGG